MLTIADSARDVKVLYSYPFLLRNKLILIINGLTWVLINSVNSLKEHSFSMIIWTTPLFKKLQKISSLCFINAVIVGLFVLILSTRLTVALDSVGIIFCATDFVLPYSRYNVSIWPPGLYLMSGLASVAVIFLNNTSNGTNDEMADNSN